MPKTAKPKKSTPRSAKSKNHNTIAYPPRVINKVIALITKGVTLIDIGKMRGMPAADTILQWTETRPDFTLRYNQAREGHLHLSGAPKAPYNPVVAEEILKRIASGEVLTDILKDGHMPELTTVYQWRIDYPEFLQQYTQARMAMADTYADRMNTLADKCRKELENIPDPRLSNAWKETYRLELDALKWTSSKLRPQLYGDKAQIDVSQQIKVVQPERIIKGKVAGLGKAEAAKVE